MATCYFPNRAIDTLSVPCNSSAQQSGGASSCCRPNDACYESGACFQDWSGVMYRQSCTDPTFRDPACPKMCLGEGMLKDGIWILTCDMKAGKACCLTRDEPCCGNASTLFDFKPGYIKAVLNGDGTNRLGPYVTSGEASSANPMTTSTSRTSAIVSSSMQLPDSTNSLSITHLPSDSSSSPEFSTAAIATTTVLGVLLIISLLALVFIWLRRSRHKKQNNHSLVAKPTTVVFPRQTLPETSSPSEHDLSSGKNPMVSEARQMPNELPGDMRHYELSSKSEL